MSTKHLFTSSENLVNRSIKGIIATHTGLSLIPATRVVYDPNHDPRNVSVVSGGGSGHEPAYAGYVGKGMLTAAAYGDIFASPSAKQIISAIEAVPSQKGTLLVVTNYTGDQLHFGLAAERSNASGRQRIGIVTAGDDVAVGRKAGGMVGRRGLAGFILLCKIIGAAAAAGRTFEDVLALGTAASSNLASVATSLDHCHVPGRTEFTHLGDDVCEIGMGLHNEPGYRKVSPMPTPEALIKDLLSLILSDEDLDRAFVPFKADDDVVVFINNVGGMSVLEMGAALEVILSELETVYGIHPVRVFCGTYMTSLNGPGLSISLLNVTRAATVAANSQQLLSYIDASHETLSWGGGVHSNIQSQPHQTNGGEVTKISEHPDAGTGHVKSANPATLKRTLEAACEEVLKAEPLLTRWDTIVGDGDCGETCALGASAVLSAIRDGLTDSGDLIYVLHKLTDILEDACGGTLGAIFSLYLAALTTEVRAMSANSHVTSQFWGGPADRALARLRSYTPAKVGDRTLMDALIPFVHVLKNGGTFDEAVTEAEEKALATGKLTAKLGRATYVDQGNTVDVPDPGAMAIAAIVRGLRKGSS